MTEDKYPWIIAVIFKDEPPPYTEDEIYLYYGMRAGKISPEALTPEQVERFVYYEVYKSLLENVL